MSRFASANQKKKGPLSTARLGGASKTRWPVGDAGAGWGDGRLPSFFLEFPAAIRAKVAKTVCVAGPWAGRIHCSFRKESHD